SSSNVSRRNRMTPGAWSAWARRRAWMATSLPRLPVRRVATAPAAVLLELEPVRVVLLVLDGGVVAALAVAALERDDRLHRSLFLAGVGKKKPSSPRRCQ